MVSRAGPEIEVLRLLHSWRDILPPTLDAVVDRTAPTAGAEVVGAVVVRPITMTPDSAVVKKRIYLVFEGFLTPDEAQKLKDAYGRAIADVGPGYTVLSYFKDFTPGTDVIEDVFSSMIVMAIEAGCRKAARVSSRSVLRPLQMSRLAKVRSGYPSRQFDTWEQAEAYLDGDED